MVKKKLTKTQKLINKRERHKKSKTYLKNQVKIEYKKALREWGQFVIKRDNYTCQICFFDLTKSKKYQPHHILDKKNYKQHSLDKKNGILLCYNCHKAGPKSPHLNAIFFSNWLKINKPEIYNYVNLLLARGNSNGNC